MIYERPNLQVFRALHFLRGQWISKPLNEPIGMGLRARQHRELTDRNGGRAPLNLSDVTKHVVRPRAAHSVRSSPNGGRGNGRDITQWLVSPGVRSSYAKDGVLLLDVTKGLSYRLNVSGAQAWVTIESSPSGITLEGIVDALETHLRVPREQLESDTADWLDKLNQLGLLQRGNSQAPNSE